MRCKLQNPGTFLGCFQLLGTTNDLQCRRECYLLLASKVERVWHLLDTKFAAAKTSEEEQARSTYTLGLYVVYTCHFTSGNRLPVDSQTVNLPTVNSRW